MLTLYADGRAAREVRLDPLHAGAVPSALDGVYHRVIRGSGSTCAVLRDRGRIGAVFVAEDRLPDGALRLGQRRREPGRWLLSGLWTGDVGGRVFFGPRLFLRQHDIGGSSAWLVTALLGLAESVEVRRLEYAGEILYTWRIDGQHYFYTLRGGRWALYGAGNTELSRLEEVLEGEGPKTAREHLWAVGAVRLS